MYAATGSVTLPRFVFEWLRDSRNAAFTVADIGLLYALLAMFENRTSLFMGGRFEEQSREPVLILKEEELRFPGGRNNDPLLSGHSGYVRERVSLRTLRRTGWFEVEREAGELRIRLGERAKKLREGT